MILLLKKAQCCSAQPVHEHLHLPQLLFSLSTLFHTLHLIEKIYSELQLYGTIELFNSFTTFKHTNKLMQGHGS